MIGIVVGAVVLVVAVPIVLILAVTLLGRSADSEFQEVGVAIEPDGRTVPVGAEEGFTPIDPQPTDPSDPPPVPTFEPGLHDFCPSSDEVGQALGEQLRPGTEQHGTTQLSVNDVVVDVVACEYGNTIHVGHVVGVGADTAIGDLSDSSGRFGIVGSTLDVPSVRIVLPGGVDGSERLVFAHGDQVMTVAGNGATWDQMERLAELVLSRPPPG